MTERAWWNVRAAVQQMVRQVRDRKGDGPGGYLSLRDLTPVQLALGLPIGTEPPARPDTWMTVKGATAWWVTPVGETDPDKADVWIAVLNPDGTPDYDTVYTPEDASHWEDFVWGSEGPTPAQIRDMKARVISALGLLSGGPPPVDHLTTAADKMREHISQLARDMKPVDNDHLNAEYEGGIRNATGGVMGDFAAGFNPDVAGYTSDLLTAIATDGTKEEIRRLAELVGQSYNKARQGDEHRSYHRN